MLLLVSDLVGQPIITLDEAEPVGVIRDPIIDPKNGKLVAFFFGYGLFHMKQSVIASDDIVDYSDARVIVQHAEIARDAHEEPKIAHILKEKIPVLGARVFTESGKNLGRANDLLLDTEMHMVVKYYIKGLMNDRIIAAEHVIAIDKRGIMVDDTAPSAAAAAVEAS